MEPIDKTTTDAMNALGCALIPIFELLPKILSKDAEAIRRFESIIPEITKARSADNVLYHLVATVWLTVVYESAMMLKDGTSFGMTYHVISSGEIVRRAYHMQNGCADRDERLAIFDAIDDGVILDAVNHAVEIAGAIGIQRDAIHEKPSHVRVVNPIVKPRVRDPDAQYVFLVVYPTSRGLGNLMQREREQRQAIERKESTAMFSPKVLH